MLKTYKSEEPIKVMEVKEEQVPLIVEQKRRLERLIEDHDDLRDRPRELKDRVLYLCLRGLRGGFLQYISMFKIRNIAKINNFLYFERVYDPSKRKMTMVKEKFGDIETEQYKVLDPVQENIKRRLMEDPIVKNYFTIENNEEILESTCLNFARGISENYFK